MKKPKSQRTGKPSEPKLVALTVKIDSEMYVKLSTLRAKERKTAQEILTEALQDYLKRAGA
jgi:predicted transcriptional regulator